MAEAARSLMADTFVEKEAIMTELRNTIATLEAQASRKAFFLGKDTW